MKAKDIITCLTYKRNRIPTFMLSPLRIFLGGFLLIIIVAVLVALIPELRPRFMWSPLDTAMLPKLLSRFVVFYPVAIIMGLSNPSGRQLSEFHYHWKGMEVVLGRYPYTTYASGMCKKPKYKEIQEVGNILKNFFSENFNLSIIARNHRIYLLVKTTMFWLSNLCIVSAFVYIGYIAGISYHRTYSSKELEHIIVLLRQLLWAPILGYVLQYLLLYIFPINSMWAEEEDYADADIANAKSYLRRYNLEGEINDVNCDEIRRESQKRQEISTNMRKKLRDAKNAKRKSLWNKYKDKNIVIKMMGNKGKK